MNGNSGYDERYMDDGAWDNLFKMAEDAEYESDFEGQDASGSLGRRMRRYKRWSDIWRSDRGRRR